VDLIEAGTVTTGNTVTISHRSSAWYVMATTAAQFTVKFGDRGPTITVPSTNTGFVCVPGSYQKILVTGATVAYYVVD
jgi:hypothetical protein